MNELLPILYSFRRCPFAMRARLALKLNDIKVELREVDLRHKPAALHLCSPKATVPVLQLPNGKVIDESLAIMHWAFTEKNKSPKLSDDAAALIECNDQHFKPLVDRYKYADRYPEFSQAYYFEKAQPFLQQLNASLTMQTYLAGEELSFGDLAIFPFVRQWAQVNRDHFNALAFVSLQAWLVAIETSALFNSIMVKYPRWSETDTGTIF